jgi:large subunit ribosomal protein L21e
MVHSYGKRARTRHLFSRPFRQHGQLSLGLTYLRTFHLGDFVDIKGVGSVHKGMPYKFYHGKTGRIWNITPRAVGVEVNKVVRGKILKKRIHVRIEHAVQSRCQEDFKKRIELTRQYAEENKKNKDTKDYVKKKLTKRQPKGPKAGYTLSMSKRKIVNVSPVAYVDVA